MQHLPVDRHADLTGVGCRAYRLAVAMIASYPIAFPFRHFRMESPGYWENGSSAAQDLVHLPRGLTLQAAMRSSRLPAVKTLAQFDFTFQPSIKREQIESLHELGFHNRAENVILLGPPGVGKTHLAINLAIAARAHRSATAPLPYRQHSGQQLPDAGASALAAVRVGRTT